MFNTRKLLFVLACCTLLAVLIPFQTAVTAPRTVLMELMDATW